ILGAGRDQRLPATTQERHEIREVTAVGGKRVTRGPLLGLEDGEEFFDGVGSAPHDLLARSERVEHDGLYQRDRRDGKIAASAFLSVAASAPLATQKASRPPAIGPTSSSAEATLTATDRMPSFTAVEASPIA